MKNRSLAFYIKRLSEFFPVLLLTGPRQTGKTTLLEMCAEEGRAYVSLDSIENRELACRDPELFLERYKTPLTIDEIQYAPNLMTYIKIKADTIKKNGMYWLTGSQQFLLMKNISQSLAGRIGIINLQGFSQEEKFNVSFGQPFLPTPDFIKKKSEISPKFDLMEIYKLIWKGSYPKLFLSDDYFWQTFYDSYIQTYIERDVRQIVNIGNTIDFQKFMKVIASRTGNLLNYSDIAKDVGISLSTAKIWTSILEASGIIFLLQPYFNNLTKRVIKTPKVYFFDTGLVCYLTGWKTPETLENGAVSGNILENYAISEIIKSYIHNGEKPSIYFYRDKDQREIDLIIEENGMLYPIEIKKKSNPTVEDIKHFRVIEEVLKQKCGFGGVVCLAQTHLPITDKASAIPVWYI